MTIKATSTNNRKKGTKKSGTPPIWQPNIDESGGGSPPFNPNTGGISIKPSVGNQSPPFNPNTGPGPRPMGSSGPGPRPIGPQIPPQGPQTNPNIPTSGAENGNSFYEQWRARRAGGGGLTAGPGFGQQPPQFNPMPQPMLNPKQDFQDFQSRRPLQPNAGGMDEIKGGPVNPNNNPMTGQAWPRQLSPDMRDAVMRQIGQGPNTLATGPQVAPSSGRGRSVGKPMQPPMNPPMQSMPMGIPQIPQMPLLGSTYDGGNAGSLGNDPYIQMLIGQTGMLGGGGMQNINGGGYRPDEPLRPYQAPGFSPRQMNPRFQ